MPSHDVIPGIEALGCGFNPFDSDTRYKPHLFDAQAGQVTPYKDSNPSKPAKVQGPIEPFQIHEWPL
jgi:hypothetical protein